MFVRQIRASTFTGYIAILLVDEVIDPATPAVQHPRNTPSALSDALSCISELELIDREWLR